MNARKKRISKQYVATTFFIVFSFLVLPCTCFSAEQATATEVRTISEANELLKAQALEKFQSPPLRLGFLKVTFHGKQTSYLANYYTDTDKITAKLSPTGETQFSLNEIRSQKQRDQWASVTDDRIGSDLDSQLLVAEKKVRADGFTPTGGVILQYHYYPPVTDDGAGRDKTSIFFKIADSNNARVVRFENGQFTAHSPGKVITIPALKIPQIKLPELNTPELKRIDSPLNSVEGDVVESFSVSEEETLLRIEGDFLFDFDSDEPRPDADKLIASLAQLIQEQQPATVQVEGHTDSWGTPVYNDDLSDRRAQSIMKRLAAAGVDPQKLEARGFGETRPVAAEITADGKDDPAGRQKNRRVEVRLKKT